MNLFFGNVAVQKLIQINSQLKYLSLERSRTELNFRYEHFQPWMSTGGYKKRYSQLSKMKDHETIHLVNDPQDLDLLNTTFSKNVDCPDIFWLNPSDTFRRIMSPDSCSLQLFTKSFGAGLMFVKVNSPAYWQLITSVVEQIIPIESNDPVKSPLRQNGSGLTTHNYRGGIFISPAESSNISAFENILNLIHELGHTCFNIYLCCDDIIKGDDKTKPIYSVVRKVYRPAILSFHALVACAFMLDFCQKHRRELESIVDDQYLESRVRGLCLDVEIGWATCITLKLSPLGLRLLAEIESLFKSNSFNQTIALHV